MSRKRKKKKKPTKLNKEKNREGETFPGEPRLCQAGEPWGGRQGLCGGFAIIPCPGEGFGVSGAQQGPRGEGRDRSLLLAPGACRVTRVGLSTCGSVGVGTGRGAGHIAELTGTRTSAQVGGR